MRQWSMVVALLAGCTGEPDWYEGCAADCAPDEICVSDSPTGDRCVADVLECDEVFAKGTCAATPDACVLAVCGQADTFGTECWLDRDDTFWHWITCGVPF